ncbi:MAG TPA: aminotransferase class V-fold PLP-dependent enzyme [Pararhodobacter sp.]|uniref:cysteine desulfurase family protein n=1 Tax=Pararhodobacter sp. TaxID=2127056 RepID=UPI002CDD79C1|nr:aminotransferase class V-fold PLP-dependent enzyme [Pararhodobacter sp.]HPD92410.1 aminotransferase class V-fold PLP-dependent enzyme [Pararhodobacter sp.]
MNGRLYLDWNAATPLRPEARAAMIAAMDLVGNASSIHAEGRAVRGLIEAARAQVSQALGAEGADLVFTSGATEAAALALAGRDLSAAGIEHDAVAAWCRADLPVDADGQVRVTDPARATLQLANSETGIVQDLPEGLAVSDLTQAFGKIPMAFNWLGCDMGLVSAHKLGGPKGIGALALKRGLDVTAGIRGGGQEMGRRAGTENVIGIAGFGAAAEAAARDLARGVWDQVAEVRNTLEQALEDACPGIILTARGMPRLPNTVHLIAPGWKGETQVMAMDLQGFAVSAGSACSSGKVSISKVVRAMGRTESEAGCALRLSIGPGVGREDALRFVAAYARAWKRAGERMKQAGAALG